MRGQLRGYTHTVVTENDPNMLISICERNPHRCFLGIELDGIRHQVLNHAAEMLDIDSRLYLYIRYIKAVFKAGLLKRGQQRADFLPQIFAYVYPRLV